jgi:uncharacterized RDD family membrane protein YckC
LPPGSSERCPFCGTLVGGPVEGSLAPQPQLDAPDDTEPLREIPGLRRRERTWKDEVRERVRQRKQQRSGGELPLFPEEDEEDAAPLAPSAPIELGDAPEPLTRERARELDTASPPLDLPLRHVHDGPLGPEQPLADPPLDDELCDEAPATRWTAGESNASIPFPATVERPAAALERAEAGAVDLALLLALWSVVVYFASRAAHVTVAGLLPSWPYLAAYLAGLGLLYAGYFTGTTGQTLGKIAVGLRVVDSGGQPPGYFRASARALVGSVGVLLAGAALVSMAFDPARRALHDRLLKTRVVSG